jgi:hypothetical protein
MIISAFTPQVVTSRAKPYEYDFNLIATVMKSRQDAYNKTFEGLKNLRKQALNIRFLNESAQADIDAKNKKINDYFDGLNNEYGDLADAQVANRYSDLFKEIAQDTDLLGQYRTDVALQKQIQDVEKLRKSSDPIKAGFHPMHYENYLQGVQSYIKSDYKTEKVQVDPYVPYIDMNKELAVIMRGIPISKTVRDVLSPDGYIIKTTTEGRDPLAVQQAAQEYITSKGGPQLRERAKYYYRNTVKDDEDKLFLHSKYVDFIDTQITQLKESLPTAENKEAVQQRISVLQQKRYEPDEYLQLDDSELIDHLATIETYESMNSYVQSYGRQSVSQEIRPDQLVMHREKLAATLNPATGSGIEVPQTAAPIPVITSDIIPTIDSNIKAFSEQLSNDYSGTKYQPFLLNYLRSNTIPSSVTVDGKQINLADTVFFRAFKQASDIVKRNGMSGMDDKKLLEVTIQETERILTDPATPEEVDIYNHRQMVLGRKQAFESLLQQAQASGNVTEFFEKADLNMFLSYTSANVDPSAWGSKEQKEAVASYRNKVMSYFNAQISSRLTDAEREDEPLSYIDPTMVLSIDRHPSGQVTLRLDPEKFGTEDKPGPLYNKYIGYSDNGVASFIPIEPTITLKVPELDEFGLSRNLPFYLSNTPQKFYGTQPNGTPVPFEVYRNSDGKMQYRIRNGQWVTANDNNVERLISTIQTTIKNAPI